jgi:hypothetical protein
MSDILVKSLSTANLSNDKKAATTTINQACQNTKEKHAKLTKEYTDGLKELAEWNTYVTWYDADQLKRQYHNLHTYLTKLCTKQNRNYHFKGAN